MSKIIFPALLVFLLASASAFPATTAPHATYRIILPTARDITLPGGLALQKLGDQPMRYPSICVGGDGAYYLTGTTPDHAAPAGKMWLNNDGIRLWRSSDLANWTSLGLVWNVDTASPWANAKKPLTWMGANPPLSRAAWAPNIHYFDKTYWIAYSMLSGGTGLLKSSTGKPDGPYIDMHPSGPLTDGLYGSVFADTDGSIYFLHDGYNIAKMKADASDLAEPDRLLKFFGNPGWGEAISLQKINGHYVFLNCGDPNKDDPSLADTYDCYGAVSVGDIYGPYIPRYRAIPDGAGNTIFQDKQMQWWSTFFGSGPLAPWIDKPAILPIQIDAKGRIEVQRFGFRPVWHVTSVPASSTPKVAAKAKAHAASTKPAAPTVTVEQVEGGAFGDPVISQSGPVTDVGTLWTTRSLSLWQKFDITGQMPKMPSLYMRADGPTTVTINFHPVATIKSPMPDYALIPFPATVLHRQHNLITVHAAAGAAPNYVDVGIVEKLAK
jgi:hypothetical protein